MPTSQGDSSRATGQEHLQQFGDRVRLLRHINKLSQEQLAHAAGLHRTEVGKIERGERNVGIVALWPLAEALKVQVADLFRSELP